MFHQYPIFSSRFYLGHNGLFWPEETQSASGTATVFVKDNGNRNKGVEERLQRFSAEAVKEKKGNASLLPC